MESILRANGEFDPSEQRCFAKNCKAIVYDGVAERLQKEGWDVFNLKHHRLRCSIDDPAQPTPMELIRLEKGLNIDLNKSEELVAKDLLDWCVEWTKDIMLHSYMVTKTTQQAFFVMSLAGLECAALSDRIKITLSCNMLVSHDDERMRDFMEIVVQKVEKALALMNNTIDFRWVDNEAVSEGMEQVQATVLPLWLLAEACYSFPLCDVCRGSSEIRSMLQDRVVSKLMHAITSSIAEKRKQHGDGYEKGSQDERAPLKAQVCREFGLERVAQKAEFRFSLKWNFDE